MLVAGTSVRVVATGRQIAAVGVSDAAVNTRVRGSHVGFVLVACWWVRTANGTRIAEIVRSYNAAARPGTIGAPSHVVAGTGVPVERTRGGITETVGRPRPANPARTRVGGTVAERRSVFVARAVVRIARARTAEVAVEAVRRPDARACTSGADVLPAFVAGAGVLVVGAGVGIAVAVSGRPDAAVGTRAGRSDVRGVPIARAAIAVLARRRVAVVVGRLHPVVAVAGRADVASVRIARPAVRVVVALGRIAIAGRDSTVEARTRPPDVRSEVIAGAVVVVVTRRAPGEAGDDDNDQRRAGDKSGDRECDRSDAEFSCTRRFRRGAAPRRNCTHTALHIS